MDEETEHRDPSAFIDGIMQAGNLAGELDEAQAQEIARDVVEDYDLDKGSMSEWLERMEKAIDLAALVKSDKTYPFNNAANIKYPLVTTAALQFNARAYPAIVPATDVVKCRAWGKDEGGQKAARGDRVAAYMSWQLLHEIEEWEEETDKLLVQLPIVGDMFRKVWWDGERARCRIVAPGKVVINNNVTTLADAPRVSEELSLYPHEIERRFRDGRFERFEYNRDDEDDDAPELFIEQHCRLDLDEDGYPEPYIVTVHKDTLALARLVPDFEPDDVQYKTERVMAPTIVSGPMGEPVPSQQEIEVKTGIISIRRNSYFVHYQFMPGMREGLLGTGLGVLLGDISEAINTSFNMLTDAGHYASLGGGFIGSEFRVKGGSQRFRPGEWKQVQATGGDVRSAIVPQTYPGPDATMFQMLGLLIDAGKEVASVQDIMTGDTGTKNMTATTTLALIEQGLKVFTAAYKRIFRSMKREFDILMRINAATVPPEKYMAFHEMQADPRADFMAQDMDIEPVADPNAVTKMQEMAKAQVVMELLGTGQVNPAAAVKRVLETAGIPEVEELLPQPDPMQQQMMQMQMQGLQADLSQKMADMELTMARVMSERAKAMKDVAGVEAEGRARRFDEVMRILEMQRDDLARELSGARDRVAGKPGNAGAASGPAIAVGPPQVGAGGGLLVGPAGPGIGAGGYPGDGGVLV